MNSNNEQPRRSSGAYQPLPGGPPLPSGGGGGAAGAAAAASGSAATTAAARPAGVAGSSSAGAAAPLPSKRNPSPAVDARRRATARPQTVLQSQGNAAARQRDKFVSLAGPGDGGEAPGGDIEQGLQQQPPSQQQQQVLEQQQHEQQQQQQAQQYRQQQLKQQLQQLQPPPRARAPPIGAPPRIFEDLDDDEGPAAKGRIAVTTVAESLDRAALDKLLRAKFPHLQLKGYEEVLHATPSLGESSGDAFFFDYGVTVFWCVHMLL